MRKTVAFLLSLIFGTNSLIYADLIPLLSDGRFFDTNFDEEAKGLALHQSFSVLDSDLQKSFSLPEPLERMAISQKHGRIYISGGYAGNSKSNAVYSISIGRFGKPSSPWRSETGLPEVGAFHGMAFLNDRLYVAGMGESGSVYSAEVKDGIVGQWRSEIRIPSVFQGCDLVAYGNRLYIFARDGSRNIFSSSVTFLGKVVNWRRESSIPLDTRNHALAYASGRIYISGGESISTSQIRNDVLSVGLDSEGNITGWRPEPSLPKGISGHSMCAGNGVVIVSGGKDIFTPQSKIYSATMKSEGALDKWSEVGIVKGASLQNHSSLILTDGLFVMSGRNEADKIVGDAFYSMALPRIDPSKKSRILTHPFNTTWDSPKLVYSNGFLFNLGFLVLPIKRQNWVARLQENGNLEDFKLLSTQSPENYQAANFTSWRDMIFGLFFGNNSPNILKIFSTKVEPTGNISPWRDIATINNELPSESEIAAGNGKLFFIPSNGDPAGANGILSADIHNDGTLSPWNQNIAIPYKFYNAAPVVTKKRFYLMGGIDFSNGQGGVPLKTVYSALIDSTGFVQNWKREADLPIGMKYPIVINYGEGLFLSGWSIYPMEQCFLAPFTEDNKIGSWQPGGDVCGDIIARPSAGASLAKTPAGIFRAGKSSELIQFGAPLYPPSGYYLSPLIDLGAPQKIKNVSWESVAVDQTSTLSVSHSIVSDRFTLFPAFSFVNNGQSLQSSGQYVQFRVDFNSGQGLIGAPLLKNVRLSLETAENPTSEKDWVTPSKTSFSLSKGLDFQMRSEQSISGTLKIYSPDQHLVRTISFTNAEGLSAVHWDGRDDGGNMVYSDIYYAVFETNIGRKVVHVAGILQ